MIDQYDKGLEWTHAAKSDMTFTSMIDAYYAGKLLKKIDHKPLPYQPYHFYKWLYERHKDLVLDIVEIFFPELVFKPCDINDSNTNEFHLFRVINEICNIEWFLIIQDSSYKAYEKKKKEYDAAHMIIMRYAKGKTPYEFPAHKNEILTELKEYFSKMNRDRQGEKIIKAIKDEYDIKTATQTKAQKIDKSIKNLLNKAKKYNNI